MTFVKLTAVRVELLGLKCWRLWSEALSWAKLSLLSMFVGAGPAKSLESSGFEFGRCYQLFKRYVAAITTEKTIFRHFA